MKSASPTRNTGTENFPVGSWLLPAQLRPHILAFYTFARSADDIADSADLSSDEKIRLLDEYEMILQGQADHGTDNSPAVAMHDSLIATGLPPDHCLNLLKAFRQDAVKSRYAGWAELMEYCRLSAAPVGRYMIDLHGGTSQGYGASDALCMALQVLNHIQDCGDDYRKLGRIYLPQDWIAEIGMAEDDLAGTTCSPALRQVLDWTLTGIDALLADSSNMVVSIKSRRLALESAIIISIAHRLRLKLAINDPLTNRVALNKLERLVCVAGGLIGGLPIRL